MAVKKAVQSGNVEDAIEKVNDLNPEVRIFYVCLVLLWNGFKVELQRDTCISLFIRFVLFSFTCYNL